MPPFFDFRSPQYENMLGFYSLAHSQEPSGFTYRASTIINNELVFALQTRLLFMDTSFNTRISGLVQGGSATINSICEGANGRIIVGTEGSGVWYSDDDGDTWTPWSSGLVNAIRSVTSDKRGTVVAATNGNVRISYDNGANWVLAQTASPNMGTFEYTIAGAPDICNYDEISRRFVLCGRNNANQGRIATSTDGVNWNVTTYASTQVLNCWARFNNKYYFFSGGNDGACYSSPVSGIPTLSRVESSSDSTMTTNPFTTCAAGPNTIFAVNSGLGIYKLNGNRFAQVPAVIGAGGFGGRTCDFFSNEVFIGAGNVLITSLRER